jgi:hypothetical protein
VECKLFNHELIYLNPNYKDEETPQNYRDWLDLIYESIHHPENPTLNTNNEGVKRASELISYENINPYEWELSKQEVGRRKVIKLEREDEKFEIANNLKGMGIPNEQIAQATGLSIGVVEQL